LSDPLSAAEVNQLDAVLLPALERHHLRLLAHSLRTLQLVHGGRCDGQLPTLAHIEQWLLLQPSLSEEPLFAQQLAQQLLGAGQQLERRAQQLGLAPLELDLDSLIAWAQELADQRLASEPPTRPQTAPTAPPASP